MSKISESALLQTPSGFQKCSDIDFGKTPILCRDGTYKYFRCTGTEVVNKNVREVLLWGVPDITPIHPDTKILGLRYVRCPDLGGPLGICRPYNRCWQRCPSNPQKLAFSNPELLSTKEVCKYAHVVFPVLGNARSLHLETEPRVEDNFLDGYNPETRNKILARPDLVDYFGNDFKKLENFLTGMYSAWDRTIVDKWNYILVFDTQREVQALQFLLLQHGVAAAAVPYFSKVFGHKFNLVWCKDKRKFHYKMLNFEKKIYSQVQRFSLVHGTEYRFLILNNEEPIAAPFVYY